MKTKTLKLSPKMIAEGYSLKIKGKIATVAFRGIELGRLFITQFPKQLPRISVISEHTAWNKPQPFNDINKAAAWLKEYKPSKTVAA